MNGSDASELNRYIGIIVSYIPSDPPTRSN